MRMDRLLGSSLLILLTLLIKGLDCMYDEEGPSFFEEPPSRVDFLNEKGVQVNCSARGRPKPMITWSSNDGSPLFDVPGLRYVAPNGALVFNPFAAESYRPDVHLGNYRCIAANSFGTIVSRDVRLRAVVRESFEPQVHNVRAVKDFPVLIQCVVPNLLRDFVTVTSWIYGSLNILPGSGLDSQNFVMLDDGQLLIWQVSNSDAYNSYQCRTYHRLTGETSVSAPAKLIVTEGADEGSRPVIEHKSNNVNVIAKENERVVLPCIAYGHPRPAHKWLKREGGRLTAVIDDMSDDLRLSSRHTAGTMDGSSGGGGLSTAGLFIRHGALIFNSVRVANKGSYICNVSNAHGFDSMEVHLTVRSSLTVNLQPEKSTVDLGKNVELNCFASGEPPPTVQWMKDGRPLRPGNTAGRIRFIGPARIQVVGVQREDQGIYQCIAKNDYETVQSSAQLWLGDSPPKFLYRFIEQSLQPGPAISLKCSASGNPTPQISWFLDGFELPKSDRFLMGQYANVYGDVISHVNITSVQLEDGGLYECVASNRAGKETHAAALNIYGPPHVRGVPDIMAVAGKRMRFKCPVGGYPIETISFFKDGKKMNSGSRHEIREGSLFIENTERSDEGSYTCRAENKGGLSAETTVKIRVIVPPKITPFSFPPWVRVRERAGVQCIVSIGDPPFELTWIKDTIPLHSTTFTSIGDGSSRKNIEINVPAPSFSSSHHTEHHHQRIHEQQQSEVGDNSNKNSWKPGTTHVSPSSSSISTSKIIIGHSEFSSYLNIPSIAVEHMGNYTCQTKSLISGEIASYTAQLTVNAAIKVSKFFFEDGLIADRGMRTQVICAATEGEPDHIMWFKDNVELPTTTTPKSHSPTVQDSTTVTSPNAGISIDRFGHFSSILTIVNVSAVYSGNYKCILANKYGQTSHQAQLIVRVPPKFVVEPKDQHITVGAQVLIDCQAEGMPKPKIHWKQLAGSLEKKEFREVGYRTPGVLAVENGTLIISRVTEDHAGYYACIASQPANTDHGSGSPAQQQQSPHPADLGAEISKVIHLLVNVPPRIKARPPKEIVKRGDTAVLRCEIAGDQPIRVSWFARGVRLMDTLDPRYSVTTGNASSELSIREVTPEDAGDFECFANNPYGQDQIWISLLVQERPKSPRNFHMTEKSSRSVMLAWSPPENPDSTILNYVVSYKEESENWEEHRTRKKSISGDHYSMTVKNLMPATNYEFRLFARNSQGSSEPSNVLQVRTDSEPPGGPPVDVTAEAISSTEIRLMWKPPRREDWNGQLLGYNIRYRNARDDLGAYNWTRLEIEFHDSSTPMSKFISGLDKYEEYHFTVQAYNEKGPGPYSNPVASTTMEDVPSAPPENIHCSPLTPHSLQISWYPPPRNSIHGVLQGFRVYVEQLPGSELLHPQQQHHRHHSDSWENLAEYESKVPAASMSTVMHNFLPWTNYSVQVQAYTRVGHGVESVPIYCQTKESVPSEPSAIKAVVSSLESVIVSWLPPKTPNGLLVKFNVYIRISGAGREIRTVKRNLPSHVLHYEVTDLKRRESYEAWVTAETSAGEGQSTISVPFAAPPSIHLPAAIVSFGTVVWTAWKTDVTFPCHHVGSGVLLHWYKRDAKITENSRIQFLPNGSVGIANVEKGDSGNISCVVKNLYGTDQITYVLKVQVAPTPPLLHATATTNSSVRLQWKQGDNGGAPILGFTLIYRRDGGEWEEVSLSRKLSNHDVSELSCGRVYEFFLTGYNAIGSSEPSEVIRVSTKGAKPVVPPVEEFLQSDSTSIRLNFSSWANLTEDCPITRYVVEYKTDGSNWISVAGDTKGLVEINQLSPEMEYRVRVTAFNGAGSTSGEFLVSTSLYKGGLISSNLSRQVPFYKDPYIIAPIVASLASVILAAAGVILCWKRSKFLENFVGSATMDRRTNLALAATDRDYTVIRAKYFPECDRFPDTADDIYPYATFQLAEPEKANLSGNLPESYLYGATTARFQAAETLPVQTNPRGTLRGTSKRRKPRNRMNNRSENEMKMGESDEYDSLHSDSDATESPRRLGSRYAGRGADIIHGTLSGRGPRRQKSSSYEEDVLAPYLEETSFVYARASPGLGDFPPRTLIRSELNNQRNCDMNGIGQRGKSSGGGGEPLYQALEASSVAGPKMSHGNYKKNFLRSGVNATDALEPDMQRRTDYTIAV